MIYEKGGILLQLYWLLTTGWPGIVSGQTQELPSVYTFIYTRLALDTQTLQVKHSTFKAKSFERFCLIIGNVIDKLCGAWYIPMMIVFLVVITRISC